MIEPAPYMESEEPDGFVFGMPESRYHAEPSISKSGLDLVAKSPAHYKHAPPREPTPAMKIGTAIHRAVLEPGRFDMEYEIVDAKDRRQKAYKDAVQEHGDDNVLLGHEAKHVLAVRRAVHDHPQAGFTVRADGHRELSAFVDDPVTGVRVRCRYDLLSEGWALDLKKSRDVFPHGFSRSVGAYRYHVQVALYSDIYEWLTGERLETFWLLAVEDQPPHTPVLYQLDDEAIELGRRHYRRDLNTYAECLASGQWPKFEPEHSYLSLPGWLLAELDDELEVT